MVQRPLPESQNSDIQSRICRELSDVDAALSDSPYMAPVVIGVKRIINELDVVSGQVGLSLKCLTT